jgi:hypothetical protein
MEKMVVLSFLQTLKKNPLQLLALINTDKPVFLESYHCTNGVYNSKGPFLRISIQSPV